MTQRVLIRPDSVRISKPGVDVASAAEKDLLISLGARNAQIIQRGFLPMPAAETIPGNTSEKKWTWNVWFPAQQSVPDLRATVIASSNVDNSLLLNPFPPTQNVTFYHDRVTIEFVGAGLGNVVIYGGLIYALFRKRVDS